MVDRQNVAENQVSEEVALYMQGPTAICAVSGDFVADILVVVPD